jgi:hypothetical protein
MLGVIKGLGQLPSDDNEIEDRVLACMLVAWGELAAMQDAKRRDEVVGSLGDLGKRVVGKLIAVAGEMNERAESKSQSLVQLLYESVADGTAEELSLPKPDRGEH